DLPVLMRRAFAEAVRAPAGPVFVSIPMDLLAEESIVDVPARSAPVTPGVADGIPAAAQVLAGAQRPVLIAGDGVGRENAVEELVAVAEALGAAVYHQPMADGINFPGNHPLYHGMPLPTTAAVRALLAEHDVAFVVGTHAFPAHHYTPDRPVPDGVRVVQMDSDPAQLGRNFPVEVALYGALPASLHALADRLRGKVPDAQRRGRELGAATRAARDEIDASARKRWGPGPMDPLAAVHAIATALPAGAVVIEEGITAGMLLRRVLRQDRPGSYRHAIGGGLGWGIGAAIGTRMGAPDRPVVAVVGDGCATFGLQALWTAAHHRIPVTFVVINNGEYRTLKDTLDRNKSRSTQLRRYVGLDLREPALDWRGAGAFFGVPVVRPAGCAELAELVAESSTLDGPRLVEVPVTGHPGGSL
ncbi:MAG: thiamine pyrophosphate-binding protein, partial [Micromonosporaceae bacterium]|nr:thiamine pyrophosphate-binding protein [Micromonosporaceae bacterium]